MTTEVEIATLAASQFGVVERRQLLMFGMTLPMIRNRIRRGALVERFPGTYRVGGAPASWKGDLLAAQLSLGPTAVVSHRSSAALFELEGQTPGILELTLIGNKRARLPGTVQHRSETLRSRDVQRLGPFRTTKPERLLVDLAAVLSPLHLEAALDSVLFKRLTTLGRIDTFVTEVRRSGLNGVGRLASLLAKRDPTQEPASSFFETDFYRFLVGAYPTRVRFQHVVNDEHGFVGRLDAAFPVERVGVEAHSLRWHSARERVQRDADRHNRLATAGWRILYETYENLNSRPQEILRQLDRLLAS